ncbi:Zinc finger MIZ-type-containing protein [Penicillium ucsense]|uniref:Zinc finger MIZ-type-containing protein n=1 Tax=Penicillium ucsense TaxID=2839758 RepID=A0A8J8W052_9EURO|nr:Zinc finger MIZ-type-containing protein [Penicillium ucsense]KAF7735881.1 Zinc finger MIZ-type-containing protein [Penicillium ucsense]
MSPGIPRSQRPAHCLEESNSTASLFLGGVRRDWMASVGEKSYPPREPPAAQRPSKATNSHHGPDPSKLPQEGRRLPFGEMALPSPVTPGTDLSTTTGSPCPLSLSTASKQLATSTAIALPSPVPSPGPHPSPNRPPHAPPPPPPPHSPSHEEPDTVVSPPVSVTDRVPPVTVNAPWATPVKPTLPRDHETSVDRTVSQQPTQSQAQVQVSSRLSPERTTETEAPEARARSDLVRVSDSLHLQQIGQPADGQPMNVPSPLISHSRPSATRPSSIASHENRPTIQQTAPHRPCQSSNATMPTEQDWALWAERAHQLMNAAASCSSSIGSPRAFLLVKACKKHDLFYLVLHQLFCEAYRDPPNFWSMFPSLNDEGSISGFRRLAELLAHNSSLPITLVDAFSAYPLNIAEMNYRMVPMKLSLFPASTGPHTSNNQIQSPVQQHQNGVTAGGPESIPQPDTSSPSTASGSANPSPPIQIPSAHPAPQNLPSSPQIWDGSAQVRSPQGSWQAMPLGHAQFHVQSPMASPVIPGQGQVANVHRGPIHRIQTAAASHAASQVPANRLTPQSSPSIPSNAQSLPIWMDHTAQSQPPQPAQNPQASRPLQPRPRQAYPGQVRFNDWVGPSNATLRPTTNINTARLVAMNQSAHSGNRHPSSMRPVHVSSPGVQTSQARPGQFRGAPVISPLLPPEGYRAPLTVQPQPMRLSLHQADLRDPVRQLVKNTPEGIKEIPLYQYLRDFMVKPTKVGPEMFHCRWKFSLSVSDHQRISRVMKRDNGQRSTQVCQSENLIYRLRIISVPNSSTEKVEKTWSTVSTTWPSVLYIFVNQEEMHVRRKVHNGKDLPLDISSHLVAGENEINMHFLLGPGECKYMHYEAAVEIMELREHDGILGQTRHWAASATRAAINKRLTPSTDDDELAVVTDSLTIPLIDPFMAQVFKIPARSVNCTHIECFDLETFVTTRKSTSGTQPLNDNWLCPVCKADARPQMLIIDGYFIEIRDALEKSGKLAHAQSIQVRADGTWTVKTVNDDGVSSSPPPNKQLSQSPSSTKRKVDEMAGKQDQGPRSKQNTPTTGATHSAGIIEID